MSMTEQQQEFFTRLCARWPDNQIKILSKSGRALHYITNRMLFNRLDNVCGPMGWFPEYKMNTDGLTCRLHIQVPDATGEWVWMYKEDGGGFAGMQSEEDNEKSGYSDAAKRAGMAWGIGRYLYRDGVPDYLGEQPPPPEPARTGPAPRQDAQREGPYDNSGGQPSQREPQRQAPNSRPAQGRPPASNSGRQAAPPQDSGSGSRGGYDNFKPPVKPGNAAYAWLKNLEGVFGAGIVKLADGIAKDNDFPYKTKEWDESQLETVCWAVVDIIKTWDNYRGEFDHLDDPRPE